MLTIMPVVRNKDIWGEGRYEAPRRKKGRIYKHKGVDYSAYPGSVILSPVDGVIERIGKPYSDPSKDDFKLIVIKVDEQTYIKIMYIWPIVDTGYSIKKGTTIGLVQDLTTIYNGITNHFHLEVEVEGVNVNPEIWITAYDTDYKRNNRSRPRLFKK